MNHGGSWNFDFGKLKYVNAIHSSSFPDGSYGGNPGGFVIEGEHKNIYIDCAYHGYETHSFAHQIGFGYSANR